MIEQGNDVVDVARDSMRLRRSRLVASTVATMVEQDARSDCLQSVGVTRVAPHRPVSSAARLKDERRTAADDFIVETDVVRCEHVWHRAVPRLRSFGRVCNRSPESAPCKCRGARVPGNSRTGERLQH